MPQFLDGQDVYIITHIDTGEVIAATAIDRYDVLHDADNATANHSDSELRSIPTTFVDEQIGFKIIYTIKKDKKTGVRYIDEAFHTKTGGRISKRRRR